MYKKEINSKTYSYSSKISSQINSNSKAKENSNVIIVFNSSNELTELFEPFETNWDDDKYIENVEEDNFIIDYLLFVDDCKTLISKFGKWQNKSI